MNNSSEQPFEEHFETPAELHDFEALLQQVSAETLLAESNADTLTRDRILFETGRSLGRQSAPVGRWKVVSGILATVASVLLLANVTGMMRRQAAQPSQPSSWLTTSIPSIVPIQNLASAVERTSATSTRRWASVSAQRQRAQDYEEQYASDDEYYAFLNQQKRQTYQPSISIRFTPADSSEKDSS